MEAVDQVRRNENREEGKKHKDLMKDSRYIWLKNFGKPDAKTADQA